MVLKPVLVLSKFSVPFRFSVYFIPKFLYSMNNAEEGRMRWAGHLERKRQRISVYRNSVGKLRGKKPLGKPRSRGRVTLKWALKQLYGQERGMD